MNKVQNLRGKKPASKSRSKSKGKKLKKTKSLQSVSGFTKPDQKMLESVISPLKNITIVND